VEPQSETVWRQADKYGVPRVAFVNKMDRVGADFARVCRMMTERLHARPVPVQLPLGEGESFRGVIDLIEPRALRWADESLGANYTVEEIPPEMEGQVAQAREALLEAACEVDEALLAKYVAGEAIGVEELRRALRRGTVDRKFYPVLCGSAFRNKGVQTLLDSVVDLLPSPEEIPPVQGASPVDGSPVERRAADDEPFSALVFKIMSDPFVGHLSFVRVYSGSMSSGSQVYVASKRKRERVGRLLKMHANKREEIKDVQAGDIAAVVGLRSVSTGETICDERQPIILEAMEFPEPVIRLAIEPKTKADQERLASGLAKLVQEDPTFRVNSDPETGQTLIAGMGELHLEILVDRLQREFSVAASVGKPQVAYRETIRGAGAGEARYIKQTGGRGQYGHVKLRVAPAATDAGLVFTNKIVGGSIPREYVPAVEHGVSEVMDGGILAGYSMRDVSVELYDGSYHEVDSSEMAFKIAGSMAFKDACRQAGLVLLEPVMKVEVALPEEYMGEVIGDLNARRGRIQSVEPQAGLQLVRALVPMAEMFGYATDLRSATQGRGNYVMQFSQYDEVPKTIAEEVLARVSGTIGR
jgi:elongation factor G